MALHVASGVSIRGMALHVAPRREASRLQCIYGKASLGSSGGGGGGGMAPVRAPCCRQSVRRTASFVYWTPHACVPGSAFAVAFTLHIYFYLSSNKFVCICTQRTASPLCICTLLAVPRDAQRRPLFFNEPAHVFPRFFILYFYPADAAAREPQHRPHRQRPTVKRNTEG